jgi:GntR family transcriptional repressor for pyruvate dehydrogenase complex
VIAIGDVKPIRRQPVSEQVAQQLLGLIQSGNLKPGEKLPPERELAETLGVSRPSLREALRALSLLGVVNIRQGGGIYVSALDPESLLGPLHFFISLDPQNIESLFEARILIESGVTALAASRITDEQLAELKDCVEFDEEALDDPRRFIESDLNFHWTIFRAAGNSFLDRVAKSLQILGRASREITAYLPGVLEKSLEDHKRIYTALRQKDPEQAAAAMKLHLCHVRDSYRKRSSEPSS